METPSPVSQTQRELYYDEHRNIYNEQPKSANKGLFILWIVLLVIGLLVIIFCIGFTVSYYTSKDTGDPLDSPNYCSDQLVNLPDISDRPFCDDSVNVKYFEELSVNVSPSQIGYQQVCMTFCPVGAYDKTTDTCNTDDQQILDLVNNCIEATRPDGCVGSSKPVAISNRTPYYAYQSNRTGVC